MKTIPLEEGFSALFAESAGGPWELLMLKTIHQDPTEMFLGGACWPLEIFRSVPGGYHVCSAGSYSVRLS